MRWLLKRIGRATVYEIQDILQAVLSRYRQLYPDWDINVMSLEKKESKNQQLESIIALLESMKE